MLVVPIHFLMFREPAKYPHIFSTAVPGADLIAVPIGPQDSVTAVRSHQIRLAVGIEFMT